MAALVLVDAFRSGCIGAQLRHAGYVATNEFGMDANQHGTAHKPIACGCTRSLRASA